LNSKEKEIKELMKRLKQTEQKALAHQELNGQLQNQFRNMQSEQRALKEQAQQKDRNHLQVPQQNTYVVNSSSDFNDRDKTFMEQFEVENREQLRRLQQEHAAQHSALLSKVQSVDHLHKPAHKTPAAHTKQKLHSNHYGYSTIDSNQPSKINIDNSIDEKLSQAPSVARTRRDYLDRIRPKSSREQKKVKELNNNQDKIQKLALEQNMQRNFEIYEQKVQARRMNNASGGVSDVLSNFGSLPEIHGRMPNA
jgi:hypothetical protein